MIKRFNRHQQDNRKYYRLNERITAPMLRVLDAEGKQVDVMARFDALRLAREQALDLVEIAAQANPPVVKLIDFKKFMYQEEKRKREEKRKAKISETKEVRLGPFISNNDLQVMINRCKDFLEDNNKVRLVVKFKGRQMAKTEFGRDVITKMIQAVSEMAKVDRDAKMEGRQMVAVLSPERKKHEKTESKESSNKTI